MSFNFRRRTSSPRTPEEYANGYTHSAVWKTSKKHLNFMGHLLDVRKILQVVGICVVVIVVLALFAGFLPEAQTYHDPFRVDRTPTTKYARLQHDLLPPRANTKKLFRGLGG